MTLGGIFSLNHRIVSYQTSDTLYYEWVVMKEATYILLYSNPIDEVSTQLLIRPMMTLIGSVFLNLNDTNLSYHLWHKIYNW